MWSSGISGVELPGHVNRWIISEVEYYGELLAWTVDGYNWLRIFGFNDVEASSPATRQLVGLILWWILRRQVVKMRYG
jgi:hypothetical protein